MFTDILLALDSSTPVTKLVPVINKLAGVKTSLTVIYIHPADWEQLLGDEWLSTTATRQSFLRYMEQKSAQQAQWVLDDLTRQLTAVCQINCLVANGKPDKVLVSTTKEQGPFDLVVLPRTFSGCKLKLDRLCKKITCPVIIFPN